LVLQVWKENNNSYLDSIIGLMKIRF
jgi:hypothetical protein